MTTINAIIRILNDARRQIADLADAAPELKIKTDRRGRARIICPACKTTPATISEVDWAEYRVNDGDINDRYEDRLSITFYQDDANFETLAFACPGCGALVRVPEAIGKDWII